jgi:putative aldouronate transport system permease protein
MKKSIRPVQILIHLLLLCFALACLLPFVMVVAGSLSTEADIQKYGYGLVPRTLSVLSYRILLLDSTRILNAYRISILVSVAGTIVSLMVNTMMAYAMSRKTLKYRKFLSMYALLTMLFSGGMVPWYIVCVNYLHLKDSLLALILPPMAGAFNMFLIRNYMQTIPEEMPESAKIEGAGELRIFLQIMLPLSKPVLATVALFIILGYWNDWFLGLMFIDKTQLQPLQLLLRTIVSNSDFVRNSPNVGEMRRLAMLLPSEGIKMAVTVITIGPIIFVYPFLQKYFVKGIMIGAVKG